MLDDDERRVELLLHALDERAERFGFALRDAGGRLVEADHARRDGEHGRELDDAAGAGRQLGDEPVGVAAEPEEVDELRRPRRAWPARRGSTATSERAPERRAVPRFERELHGLAHGELGEQRRGLERAAEAERGPLVRTLAVTSRPRSSTVPRLGTYPPIALSSVDLPAPFVPMRPITSPGQRAEVDTSSTATMPPNSTVRPCVASTLPSAFNVTGWSCAMCGARPAARSSSSRWTWSGAVSRASAATSRARSSRSA